MKKNKRILIVDDNIMSLKIYETFFQQTDFDFKICQCSKEAAKLIETNQFDGVITDLVMPDVDGIQILNNINTYQENCFKVLITGTADINILIHAINEIGLDKVLLKPMNLDKTYFINMVQNLLEKAA